MNATKIKTARKLLADRCDRIETASSGDGQCLTAHWIEGGQTIFYDLDRVEDHIRDRNDWLDRLRIACERPMPDHC